MEKRFLVGFTAENERLPEIIPALGIVYKKSIHQVKPILPDRLVKSLKSPCMEVLPKNVSVLAEIDPKINSVEKILEEHFYKISEFYVDWMSKNS